MAVHDGHRQRMRERIEKNGINGLQDHELLEYLLFGFVPRRDTNELAHRLIEEFGSFSGVLNGDVSHLAEVSGMTRNAALFLSVLPDVFRRYLTCGTEMETLGTRGAARDFLGKFFLGLDEERVYALALDVHDKVIACEMLARGGRAQVDLKAAQVVDFAKKHKAVSVIIAHNHPGGSVNPSTSDMSLTRDICTLLQMMDINFDDHFIFDSKNNYYSFDEHQHMKDIKSEIQRFKEGVWKKS